MYLIGFLVLLQSVGIVASYLEDLQQMVRLLLV